MATSRTLVGVGVLVGAVVCGSVAVRAVSVGVAVGILMGAGDGIAVAVEGGKGRAVAVGVATGVGVGVTGGMETGSSPHADSKAIAVATSNPTPALFSLCRTGAPTILLGIASTGCPCRASTKSWRWMPLGLQASGRPQA